ncbi:MAG: hypothetical protein M1816_006603 [Peltula sp. TS41687]|nr:MAG: hypothetical protein M1816_006603 [Peltula sp. TS41687]
MSKNHESPAPFDLADDDGGEERALLDPAETAEEVHADQDAHTDLGESEGEDHDGGDEEQHEITLENDSVGYFDLHRDSVYCIARHPTHPEVIATGGGDDISYIFDSTLPENPVLPASYQSDPQARERRGLEALARLDGHTDSVNAITFTLPRGEYLASGGLDGRLRVYREPSRDGNGWTWAFVAEAQEVKEINWLSACPHPEQANVVALGAEDGSVWVYTINAADQASPLTITQAYYLHTESCTAGAWSPDGRLLATVSEDGSLYVWDVFGEAAAASLASGQTVVGITAQDQRFAVEGGLYSVSVSPTGTIVVVGGAGGHIRAVSLPRIGGTNAASAGRSSNSAKGRGGGAGKASSASAAQAGQIVASVQAQSDGIETLAFSTGPVPLLAAGSIDGSIALFDTAHQFAIRCHIRGAHGEFAVVKVEFLEGGWLLTSAGMDGVVRRWDTRGGTAASGPGLVKEWKGHRGEGEGGGILGFVSGAGNRIITAGDE